MASAISGSVMMVAGVVDLAGLADDDGARADDHHALYVCALGHVLSVVWFLARENRGGPPSAPPVLLHPGPKVSARGSDLGLAVSFRHGPHEALEQGLHVVRSGARLGVPLETEGLAVGALHALQRAVEQRAVRGTQVLGEARLVHGEAVVLAGDHHPLSVEVDDRMVGAVVAELHLHGL